MNIRTVPIALIREERQYRAVLAVGQNNIDEEAQYLTHLHPNERRQYERYGSEKRRLSYLLGRLAAKHAISQLAQQRSLKSIWIDKGVFEFPVVKGSNLQNIQVSISHSDNLGLSVAYPEDHPMGVDIEKINKSRIKAILSQLTNQEKSLLENLELDNIAIYTAFFSIKEALSKVIHTGMMLNFNYLEIREITYTSPTLSCLFANFGQYKARAWIGKDYVFSIVLPRKTSADFSSFWQILSEWQV